MEIWIEFDQRKWRISPDPARIPRGTQLSWRFRGDDLNARRVLWSVYFVEGHPFSETGDRSAASAQGLVIQTETISLPDRQHVGVSPVIEADAPGEYKYGVRLEDADEGEQLGDEDPRLIVF